MPAYTLDEIDALRATLTRRWDMRMREHNPNGFTYDPAAKTAEIEDQLRSVMACETVMPKPSRDEPFERLTAAEAQIETLTQAFANLAKDYGMGNAALVTLAHGIEQRTQTQIDTIMERSAQMGRDLTEQSGDIDKLDEALNVVRQAVEDHRQSFERRLTTLEGVRADPQVMAQMQSDLSRLDGIARVKRVLADWPKPTTEAAQPKPKTKWFNIYRNKESGNIYGFAYDTQHNADVGASSDRLACVEVTE